MNTKMIEVLLPTENCSVIPYVMKYLRQAAKDDKEVGIENKLLLRLLCEITDNRQSLRNNQALLNKMQSVAGNNRGARLAGDKILELMEVLLPLAPPTTIEELEFIL
eukprot:NODE_9411_length_595_cov_15.245763_g8776_i0.p2 GENE.NODE_9411_length_595_cov_15.245763_g8776_i0~~NODE_9411_length_595_cov_15.245763_g8776_i0.p2  ORF type:complete len:107 (+),score=21.05 NODE_9411_length_595_cov_15.245763_g8776_i0:89-409(+)